MKNTLFVGLAIGMVAGACVAAKSQKAREVVSNAEAQLMNKLCPSGNQGESKSQNGENGQM